eukprot:gene7948-13839_t
MLPDGFVQLSVHCPKFKNGEATVKSVSEMPNFDYLDDIFAAILLGISHALLPALERKLEQQVPAPMHSTFDEKQRHKDAISKYGVRKQLQTIEVSGTSSETFGEVAQQSTASQERKKPATI